MKKQVVIIGGGPAGLTAAIYCGRAGLCPLVFCGIDGGQLTKTTEVENFPGFPDGITGLELITRMTDQARNAGATLFTNIVTLVTKKNDSFFITTSPTFGSNPATDDETIESAAVIIATGASAKWLELTNEEKYKNRGLSACATCDGPLKCFRNKHLFVVGGGDTAMEEAMFLTKFASKVTIVHRRDTFRASKVMVDRVINHDNIEIMWNTEIIGYEGEEFLTGLCLKDVNLSDGGPQKITIVEADGLFMGIGHTPNTTFLSKELLDSEGYLSSFSPVDGMFSAGDVYDTKYKQAVTAAGYGCMAAMACEKWLDFQK